jgi:DNA-binding YbaB/EbfC family protein
MKNIGAMMKQAQQMQAKMQEMQQALDIIEVTGQAGAGMVSITINGKGEIKKVKLEKSVIDPEDPEMLEDLIVAAYHEGKVKVERMVQEKTSELMGGLNLPAGFKLPF